MPNDDVGESETESRNRRAKQSELRKQRQMEILKITDTLVVVDDQRPMKAYIDQLDLLLFGSDFHNFTFSRYFLFPLSLLHYHKFLE